jgi:tetrapyrrole methylase family protein/MazG family protein
MPDLKKTCSGAADATPLIERLLEIMERLRAPGGCPWDREQNLQSLKQYLVEECYEVIDAIDSGAPEKHAEELGDLLLQIVFQAQVQKEAGQFEFRDVVRHICNKLIRRHPHVFSDVRADDTRTVLQNWETIKASEKARQSGADAGAPASIIGEMPRHLPALHKAHHLQKKVSRIGFDWTRTHDVVAKIEEELQEVKQALADDNPDSVHEEIGDLLFAVVNLSRFQGINAEEALNRTVAKFTRRFQQVERRVQAAGRQLTDCTLPELEEHWLAVKRAEHDGGSAVPAQNN